MAQELADFVEAEALPGTGIEAAAFWEGLRGHRRATSRRGTARCSRRATGMQAEIDDWHRANGLPVGRRPPTRRSSRGIGYLVPEGPDFAIATAGVDPEIAAISGPQLVVPVTNARYALNAANARWGSLYDALYGTDAIPESDGRERGGGYNPVRGAAVIAWVRRVPRRGGADRRRPTGTRRAGFAVVDGALRGRRSPTGGRRGSCGPGSSPAISASRGRRGSFCCATTAC